MYFSFSRGKGNGFYVVCWFKYTFCLKHETQPTVFRLHQHEMRFFLDLNSFKGISLHMLRLPIITVLFIMFIFPSKLKLNLSGVLLNLKSIIKI